MTETPSAPLRRTSLFERHQALSARMVPFAGWEMPVQYKGVVDEHRAVRERVGLFDVSHMGELFVVGPAATEAVSRLVTNDTARLQKGEALYTQACNSGGTILDDLIVYRADDDAYLIVCNGSNREKMAEVFRQGTATYGARCRFDDRSDETALIALQGPKAREVLTLAADLGAFADAPAFRFTDLRVLGVECTVARTGYTGEDGFEIFCPWDAAPQVWDGLLDLGARFGIAPCGLGARDTLRLECRMPLYGNEIDDTTDPFEAGLGWTVKLDKEAFVGKESLVERKRRGLTRKLVGIEMTGRGIARHGYGVKDPATLKPIGHVTSGSPSPTLGKSIGLAYVPLALSTVGSPIVIDCRGKDVEARVVPTPFYRRAVG